MSSNSATCNLKKQHGKTISNISEFVAWVSFSILNAKHQLKNALNFDHQLNALMKIARSREGLQRPRGFHNHWDIGQAMKAKETKALRKHDQVKETERRAVMNMEIFDENRESFTQGIGYVVSKKANELWGDEAELSSLKASRGSTIQDINACISDNHAIEALFANEPEQKAMQLEHNNQKIKAFKNEILGIDQVIKTILDERALAKEQEWQPLYA